MYNSLLKQVREWGTAIKKNDGDKFYLAKNVQSKSTPIELLASVDYVRTIKEAVEYFAIVNKEYTIHIVIEQTELKQLKEELKKELKKELKEELSDESPCRPHKREDTVDIKEEYIKKEKPESKLIPRTESTLWRILKFKTGPAPSRAESPHKRAHSHHTDDSVSRADEDLAREFEETDALLGFSKATEEEEEEKKKKNPSTPPPIFHSPPALRTRQKKKKKKNTQ
jgi:hypothetical protein